MRKKWILLLGVVMTVLSACSSASKSKPVIAVCLNTLYDPLMSQIQDAFISEFGQEYDVQVVGANKNVSEQIEQIEEFTEMQVRLLFIVPVDADTVAPKLGAARKAGSLVLVAGNDSGAYSRDAYLKMDHFLAGEYAAMLAREWIDATYPDAEPGSIQAVILGSSANDDSTARTNGLLMISDPYLKNSRSEYIDARGNSLSNASGEFFAGKSEADLVDNPLYSPAVRITNQWEGDTFYSGQQAMQAIFQTNPEIKLVLANTSDIGEGASDAIMIELEKDPVTAIGRAMDMAIFGVGVFGSAEDAIRNSSAGRGVFRGAVAYGGANLSDSMVSLARSMLEGKNYPEVTLYPLVLVTALDGRISIEPVASTGMITIK